MRQSVGGTWTLQLVILFILIFVGYIILTLNYSRTIKVKNETISIIEKYNGLNEDSIAAINKFLSISNQTTMGYCKSDAGVYGSTDLYTNVLEPADSSKKYYYCISKFPGTGRTNYYQVTLFYRFNLPVIGSLSNFSVKGSTSNFESNDAKEYEIEINY